VTCLHSRRRRHVEVGIGGRQVQQVERQHPGQEGVLADQGHQAPPQALGLGRRLQRQQASDLDQGVAELDASGQAQLLQRPPVENGHLLQVIHGCVVQPV
jgi:hypothetical protein